jgi:IclR family transcriptional regulator, mhp operon transcriptional activator
MPSYSPVQSVTRSLALLKELNRRRISTIHDLHVATRLPKPTIIRLLETLIAAGYVSGDRRQGGYQVTSLVTSLSSGFHGDHLAVEAGRAWALQLTRRFVWPTALAVLEKDCVVVRFSTVADSPMSPFHATINMRLSLISRALGLAYLAFCPDSERELLIAMLRTSSDPEDALARHPKQLSALINTVRRQGFAERDPMVAPTTSSTIAVPIFQGRRVLATLCLTNFSSAVTREEAILRFVGPLKSAAASISEEVDLLQNVPASTA